MIYRALCSRELVGEDIILPLVKLADDIRPYEDRWVFVVQMMICGGVRKRYPPAVICTWASPSTSVA